MPSTSSRQRIVICALLTLGTGVAAGTIDAWGQERSDDPRRGSSYPAAPASASKTDLFPLDPTDTRVRTYDTRHRGGEGVHLYDVRATRTERLGDGHDYVVVETTVRGRNGRIERTSREWLRRGSGAVTCARREAGEEAADLEPPQPLLVLPLEAGKRWTWTGRSGGLPCTSTSTVAGRERVVVPHGTFEAWRIDTEAKGGGGASSLRRSIWVAPGVGLIQERSTIAVARRVLQLDAFLLRVGPPQALRAP